MNRVLVSVALVGAFFVGLMARPSAVTRQRSEELMLPMRADVLGVVARPWLPIIVDLYWLRTINEVGSARYPSDHKRIARLGDLLTQLDPDFKEVYWFVGITVPFNQGREDFLFLEESNELIRRGIARHPTYTKIRLLLAYNLLMARTDMAAAAKAFEDVSRMPDAPPFAALLATRLYAEARQIDVALEFARSLAAGAQTDAEREMYEKRIVDLEIEQTLQHLDELAKVYFQRHGAYPQDLEGLRQEGLLDVPLREELDEVRFASNGMSFRPSQNGRLMAYRSGETGLPPGIDAGMLFDPVEPP